MLRLCYSEGACEGTIQPMADGFYFLRRGPLQRGLRCLRKRVAQATRFLEWNPPSQTCQPTGGGRRTALSVSNPRAFFKLPLLFHPRPISGSGRGRGSSFLLGGLSSKEGAASPHPLNRKTAPEGAGSATRGPRGPPGAALRYLRYQWPAGTRKPRSARGGKQGRASSLLR